MNGLLRSEMRKLTTTRLWLGLLAGGVALVALYVLVIAFTAGNDARARDVLPALSNPAAVRTVYGVPAEVGYLMPLILGVTIICTEYRHRTITPTLLSTPRRARVLLAKVVVAAGAGFLMGVVLSFVAAALGAAAIAARGYPVLLTSDGVPRLLALMTVALGVWCVFGLGFGALLRNQVAAVVSAIALVTIVDGLLALLLRWIHLGTVAQYLPGSASRAIINPATTRGVELLPWWGGALVLLAWGLGTALVGSFVTLRRDVT